MCDVDPTRLPKKMSSENGSSVNSSRSALYLDVFSCCRRGDIDSLRSVMRKV